MEGGSGRACTDSNDGSTKGDSGVDDCFRRRSRKDGKLTLARKLASIVLRLWKKGELWDPNKLTMQGT